MKRLKELLGIKTRIQTQAAQPFWVVTSPEPFTIGYITMLRNNIVYVHFCVFLFVLEKILKGSSPVYCLH